MSVSSQTALASSRRSGFTLVELLVVIAIIGVLIGMLAAGVMAAMNAARRAAVVFETKQLETAIETFRTNNGFYPPSNPTEAKFTQFLNRLAPNHRENVGDWWSEVGQHLDHESSLVFWLSGLYKNRQFPLTNNGTVSAYSSVDAQRVQLFDFKGGQLGSATGSRIPGYRPPRGKEDNFYRYVDSASYSDAPAYQENGKDVNPNTFQLYSAGRDNEFGTVGNVNAAGKEGRDNIVNFADGILDKFINR